MTSKLTLIQKLLKLALGATLVFAGLSHLTFARKEFLAQVPEWVPLDPDLTVIASGIAEISLGLALLLIWKNAHKVGIVVALFFVAVFPGNISQYMRGIDAFGLDSDRARFIRLFFQPVLCLWALYATGAITYLRQKLLSRSSSISEF